MRLFRKLLRGAVFINYLTDQRKNLLALFKANLHESFSAKQIYKALDDESISISAIYRNIATMEKDGLLCRVASSTNREALYQYLDPHSCAGVIHLVCDKCSKTQHLDKEVSNILIGTANENFGFKVNEQMVMIYGLCKNCSQI